MSTKAFNKNSQYVASLVSFLNDTKPYHSKLTEIVEEYQFFDEMFVNITEKTAVRTKFNPAWLYNFFSGGSAGFRSMELKQLHSPLKNVSRYEGLGWQSIPLNDRDLVAIPYVYSKKAFDGGSVADVVISRNGSSSVIEPLVEGYDYFQSRGGFQVKIKQTTTQPSYYPYPDSPSNTNFVPSWVESRDEGFTPDNESNFIVGNVTAASIAARKLANDLSNPSSAASKIRDLLLSIQTNIAAAEVVAAGGDLTEHAKLQLPKMEVLALLDGGALSGTSVPYVGINNIVANSAIQLPRDYEFLLNSLSQTSTIPPSGFTGWLGNDGEPAGAKYVDEALSTNSTSLYFQEYGDSDGWESGKSEYPEVKNAFIDISNIQASSLTEAGDTWDVVAQSDTIPLFSVFSTHNGYIGSFTAGPAPIVFSQGHITFTVTLLSQPTLGSTLKIENRNRLVFGPTAPLETWDIIKVNAISYSRPLLNSTRYGYIQNSVGVVGLVSIIDPGILPGTITLTARADGLNFDLSSLVDPLYTGVVPVNAPYNDGILAFTIVAGSAQGFQEGDKFFINVKNDPVLPVDLDLGYGYDLDSHDAASLVYNNTDPLHPDYGRPLNFVFDSRFADYNLGDLNLSLTQYAISGRKWRVRAIPNLAKPIATLKKDGSGPSASIDLQDTTSGVLPDVALTATPLYSMLGDANPAPDLQVYYADFFIVEWSDDDFNTVTSSGTVAAGNTFTDPGQGISFTLAQGSKPFIAVVSDDGLAQPAVEGGDVFSFQVFNEEPSLTDTPIALTSGAVARLVPHAYSFHEAPAAQWTITVTSPTTYTISGLQTEVAPGSQVPGTPSSGSFTTIGAGQYEGLSFKGFGVHFTIHPGNAGLDVGDTFVFTTYSKKPSYLVHGSVSGWQPMATVGETYWNGIIGFKIESPKAQLSNPALAESIVVPTAENTWSIFGGSFTVSRIRFDTPTATYSLAPTPVSGVATGWIVSRNDLGVIGHMPLGGTFADDFITVSATGITPALASNLTLNIVADDFTLWNAQDSIIIRPSLAIQLPGVNDYVLVDKRTSDSIAINLRYGSVAAPPSLAALAPVQINPTMIDTYTGINGVPLVSTSPETGILDNWIPLTLKSYDSATSLAEFGDAAIRFEAISAGSGLPIGTLRTTTSNPFFPTEFEWDLNFYSTYLPLNAESNVVTYGSGFNDIVRTRISESIRFLIGGGALTTDFMFNEDIGIQIDEHHTWNIFQTLTDSFASTISDGPFGGFLPGYDNRPYDDEGGVLIEQFEITKDFPNGHSLGFYPANFDTSVPLVDNFLEAQQLAKAKLSGWDPDYLTPAQLTPTPAELLMTPVERQLSLELRLEVRLNALIGMLSGFLVGGDLASTTLGQFLANIDAYVAVHPQTLATTGMGIPAVGMGMDITIGAGGADVNKPSTEGLGAGVQDALVVIAVDIANTYDTFGVDVAGVDALADRTAVIYSGGLPPLPAFYSSPLPPPYNDFPVEWLYPHNPLPATWKHGTLWLDTSAAQEVIKMWDTSALFDLPAGPAVWRAQTYAEFETPMAVVNDPDLPADFAARVFEINFRVTSANLATIQAMPTPKVFIWFETEAAPQQVSIVTKVGTGKYQVSIPRSTEAKLYLQPGP
jgi:hypothetical protein